jgi:choline kinase
MVTTLIMAAGTSSRMRPLTANSPKTLLPLGTESFLTRLTRQFKLAQNSDIVIITGYLNHQIDENTPAEIIKIYYTDYSSTNNYHTLNKVKEALEGPLIILFADIYLSDGAVDIIKKQIQSQQSFMVVDTRRVLKTTMGVVVEKGQVVEILEGERKEDANGNFVGIAYFTKDDFSKLSATLTDYENCESDKYYTYAIQMMIEKGFQINALDVSGHYWCEVDTVAEYEALKKDIEL